MNNQPESDRSPVTRRDVGRAGAAAMIVSRHVLGAGYQAPSDTLRIAAVGVGGMGRRYVQAVESENIVALCDVDHELAAPVFAKYPKARVYRDFRQMFDREEKNIDAVIVGTPDHNHAVVTVPALRARKHVYCAKPLTHTIGEARRIAAEAREAKVATQMSVQTCASDEACSTAEILLSGALGPVHEVHIWCDHPLYPCSQLRPTDTPRKPEQLDWDLWLGPAPYRPYHSAYHPWIWRAWWDFGNGTVADMLCHGMHVYYKALQLGAPSVVEASRSAICRGPYKMEPSGRDQLPRRIPTPETESDASMVAWDFPARAGLPPVRMRWYDGGLRPPRPIELSPRHRMPAAGLLFVGDKGKMLTGYSGGRVLLLPEEKFAGFQPPAKTLPRTIGHYKEWVEAAKTGKPTSCDFQFGSRMTEVALLGALAERAARAFEWHAEKASAVNDPEVNGWLSAPYRSGWAL